MIQHSDLTGGERERELVDLATLARELRQSLPPLPPAYLPGKTALRNEVMDRLGCSAVRAEQLVDDLERRDFIRFEPSAPSRRGAEPRWKFPVAGNHNPTERIPR